MSNCFKCPVCGGQDTKQNSVLWDGLIREWQLNPSEVAYINQQQGLTCQSCGNNLRSMVLSNAIMTAYEFNGTLIDFIKSPISQNLAVLEINDAGLLSPFLQRLPQYRIIRYPEFDILNLSTVGQKFDLVIHSDTLEHITDPVWALRECRTLLRPKGKCIYTVPTIVGRMSRSRHGLDPSYHGGGGNDADGEALRVHTEFGVDAWTYPIQAGYSSVQIQVLQYPAALAYIASN